MKKLLISFLVLFFSQSAFAANETIEMLNKLGKEHMVYSKKVVKVDIGDAVKVGDILAFLDPAEMRASLNQAIARYDLADQALNRFKDLKQKGFISNQELDRANSDYLIAKAQVDFYSVKLEQTKIRAPFNGFIQNRFFDVIS